MATTLSAARLDAILAQAVGTAPAPSVSDRAAARPVHVLYGGAHLYRADAADKLGTIARAAMDAWGSDVVRFGAAVGVVDDEALAIEVAARVRQKLEREAVEALCIDFEDGYGPRPNEEEDADALRTATELSRTPREERPIVGIRIKAFAEPTVRRAVRTLDLFVTTLARETSGRLPVEFTVTLPKVTRAAEVSALADTLGALESGLGIARGQIGIELMIESPGALVDPDGRIALGSLVAAADGRCVAAHLGAYDLTASLGVAANEQRLDHPACDLARALMQFALADSTVAVVDGATTRLPIPAHKAAPGSTLTDEAREQNANAIYGAFRLHAENVRRALAMGIYAGWDLHPAQLPARYGALFAFFLAERAAMSQRLASFIERATKATRSGQVFDDAATGQGLVNFFLRGLACGALAEDDAKATGLTIPELRSRSFAAIVTARGTKGNPP